MKWREKLIISSYLQISNASGALSWQPGMDNDSPRVFFNLKNGPIQQEFLRLFFATVPD